MKRGNVSLSPVAFLPTLLIVNSRQKARHEYAGAIPGDIEAVEGGAESDAYVVIRHKSKKNGGGIENMNDAKD